MMLDHLRHFFIPLSAGLILISCSTEEPAVQGCEMKFDISSVSRSAVTTASNITGKSFALFGDMIPVQLADDPSARTIVYDNTPVRYNGASWTTPAPQYWYDNHEHSFVAIHPASVVSDPEADSRYLNSLHSFIYTLPSDYSQISDILVATHRRKYVDQRVYDRNGGVIGGSAEVVYFQFGHVLSQINLEPAFDDNIMDEEAYIRFHKIELEGFKTKAALKIRPASLLTGTMTDDREIKVEVTGQEADGKLSKDFIDPVIVKNHQKNVRLFDDNDAVIMLPQTFSADSGARINLSYSINDETSINQISLPLDNCEWLSGKSYTYKFTINRTGLLSESTTITDWDIMEVGNIDAH